MLMKTIVILLVLILLSSSTHEVHAQSWINTIQDENPTFQSMKTSFMISGKIKRLQKAKVINNSSVGNGFGNQDFYLMESFLVLRLILMNIKSIMHH